MQITIYILRNKTTGKRYIGYTTQNIESYLGSGSYWKNHCSAYGGHTRENIDTEWHDTFDHASGLDFLSNFEEQYPEYWLSEEWANQVPETLEKSAFKGNMKTIFESKGNPFTGGEIQRRAHAEGKHNYDRSEIGRKGWKNRDRKVAVEKMVAGYKKKLSTPEGMAEHIEISKKGAAAAALVVTKTMTLDGVSYRGWKEVKEKTGMSKYLFLKAGGEVL